MNRLLLAKTLVPLKIIFGILALVSFGVANASSDDHDFLKNCFDVKAPASLVGLDLVLQIENVKTTYPNGVPIKGAVVKRFKRDGTFTAQGTATMSGQVPAEQQAFYGTYKYQRTSVNTAVEKAIDVSVNNTPTTTKYTFETETSGKWEENFGNGQIKSSGSFTLTPSNLPLSQHLAPSTKAGTSVALIIKSTVSDLPPNLYPTAGLVLQTYAQDGTLVFKGFGPGSVNSTGTYKYTKISANTAVEEVTQVSEFFTFPYTMVYTFETPTSGKWFQNFGDGLIKFYGTFDIFPN